MGDYADYMIDQMLECRHPVGNWRYGKIQVSSRRKKIAK